VQVPKTTALSSTPHQQQQTLQKGLKRASSDDVLEVPNPSQHHPQQSHVQQGQPQNRPGLMRITPEQLAALTPSQRAQYEARVRAVQQQQASSNHELISKGQDTNRVIGVQDQAVRLKEIAKELHEKTTERPVIEMTPETKKLMVQKLQNLPEMLDRMEKSIPVFYSMTGQEQVVKDLIKTVSEGFIDH
jgi:Mediator complex subunit 15